MRLPCGTLCLHSCCQFRRERTWGSALRFAVWTRKQANTGFCLSSCCEGAYSGNIRGRRSSGPARPYVVRLRALSRLICPSVWPLLRSQRSHFSRRRYLFARCGQTAALHRGRIDARPSARTPSFAAFLLRRMPRNRVASRRIAANSGHSLLRRLPARILWSRRSLPPLAYPSSPHDNNEHSTEITISPITQQTIAFMCSAEMGGIILD